MGKDLEDPTAFDRRPFRRAPWGPLHLKSRRDFTRVQAGDGPVVGVEWSRVRRPGPGEEWLGSLELGTPISLDGEVVATAWSVGRDRWGLIKPGTIRLESLQPGGPFDGVVVRGHLLPTRLTVRSAEGKKLVWSPWPLGLLNLHLGPLVWVRPRVAPEARPEHIALWLACWWAFEGNY